MQRHDQYFFLDRDCIKRVIKTFKPTGKVLEIGGGRGAITQELVSDKKKIDVVEIDRTLSFLLNQKFEGKVNVINKDVMDVTFNGYSSIVGNIPFSLSSPILFKFLASDAKKALFWLQREFAEKMVASPSDENFGRLSVMVQARSDVKIVENVSRFAFVPVPETDASVVLLKKKEKFTVDAVLVNALFQHKNQNVKNALMHSTSTLKKTKEELREMLDKVPLELREKRVYCLTFNEIEEVSKKLA